MKSPKSLTGGLRWCCRHSIVSSGVLYRFSTVSTYEQGWSCCRARRHRWCVQGVWSGRELFLTTSRWSFGMRCRWFSDCRWSACFPQTQSDGENTPCSRQWASGRSKTTRTPSLSDSLHHPEEPSENQTSALITFSYCRSCFEITYQQASGRATGMDDVRCPQQHSPVGDMACCHF